MPVVFVSRSEIIIIAVIVIAFDCCHFSSRSRLEERKKLYTLNGRNDTVLIEICQEERVDKRRLA